MLSEPVVHPTELLIVHHAILVIICQATFATKNSVLVLTETVLLERVVRPTELPIVRHATLDITCQVEVAT